MARQKKVIITVILIVLGISIAGIISLVQKQVPVEKNEYFTLEPETWITENPATENPSDKVIDVMKATREKATMDVFQEDYRIAGDILSFFYSGLYRGNSLRNVYLDEEFYAISENMSYGEKNEAAKQFIKMKIGNGMNPTDGIIEGFILAKEEGNQFVFYIFVDEDWKSQLEFTNILWGDSFADIDRLSIRQFDFSKVQDGIYIDKIENGAGWFYESPVKGGIIVGEINIPILQDIANYQFPNVTLMMVR
ncbi:hypothetical protein HYV84_06945 [Candidatus Woesearchaeota archaeon]|nr:hypothetical protein [Candidatus Woesearchaeota archaeon]